MKSLACKILFRLLLLITALIVFPTATYAVTYYVSPTGNDANNGTSLATPWRTIQKAAGSTTPVTAGDTVYVRGGTYNVANGSTPIRIQKSGTATNYIYYKAYGIDDAGIPDEVPIIYGNYPAYNDSAGVYAGIDILNDASYIHIEGFTIEGFRAGLSCKASSHHVTFKNNVLRYNSISGISSSNSGNPQSCDYMLIEGNDIYSNGYYRDGTPAAGLQEGWGSGISINTHGVPFIFGSNLNEFHTIIRNNRIYNNYDATGGDSDAWTVVDHTDGNGIILDLAGALPPTLIENNVIFDNGGRGFHPLGAQNVWFVNNTLYRNNFDPYFGGPRSEIMGRSGEYPAGTALNIANINIINNVVVPRSVQTGEPNVTYYQNYWDVGSYNATSHPYQPVNLAEIKASYNIWYGGVCNPATCVKGNPYIDISTTTVPYTAFFVSPSVNPATANFDLLAGVAAINAGTTTFNAPSQSLTQFSTVDYSGVSRSTPRDIGAFEGPEPTATPVSATATPTPASNMRIYFDPPVSPAPNNYTYTNVGSEFTLDIKANSQTQQINTIEVYINYNYNMLDVVSITPDSVNLPTATTNIFNNTNGQITYIATGANISGDNKIATIRFRAKAVTPTHTTVLLDNTVATGRVTAMKLNSTSFPIILSSRNVIIQAAAATNTPTPIPCPKKINGDANCDGFINLPDFMIFKAELASPPQTPLSDFDNNGLNVNDFLIWKNGFINNL